MSELSIPSGDMIAAFDSELHFTLFNDTYQKEFKHLFGKIITIGMSIDEALADVVENRKELTKKIQATFDDETKTYEITSSLLQGADSNTHGAIQTVRDITQSIKEHQALTISYKNLALSMQALQEKNQQISLLVEMSDIVN